MEDNSRFLDPTSIPDLSDVEEVRKAVIANEILNRKY